MHRLQLLLQHLIPKTNTNSIPQQSTPLYQKQNNRIELRQKLVDASLSIFETTNLFYFSILFVIFFRFSKQFVQQLLRQNSNAPNLSRNYSLLEPIIATMMLSTFSVFYNQMKQNILNNLKRLEDEVLLYNKMMALANAFLRKQQNRSAVYLQRDFNGEKEPIFPILQDEEEEEGDDANDKEFILKLMKKMIPTTALTVLQEDLSRKIHIQILIQPIHDKLFSITLQGFYNLDGILLQNQTDETNWKHISIHYLPQNATQQQQDSPKPIISMKFLLPKNPQIDWNDKFEVNFGAIL